MIRVVHSTARQRALEIIDKPRAGSWVQVIAPTGGELDELADDYRLDRDLLEDAMDVYESPRVEAEDDAVYIFTRYCYPQGQEIATQPLLIIYSQHSLITITRIDTVLFAQLSKSKSEIITTQKTKLLLLLLTEINRSYRTKMNLVSKQILQVRARLRTSELTNKDFLGSIELEEDLNEFLAALTPQASMLKSLISGKFLRLYEQDRDLIEDLQLGTSELIELTTSRLRTLINIRQAYDAIATNNLNRTFKRLTSIAIFLTIPTIIGGLWGMNVRLPFADHQYGFGIVLMLIAICISIAIYIFNRKKWL